MPLSMLSPIHPINKPYTIRIGLLNQGYLIRVALQLVLKMIISLAALAHWPVEKADVIRQIIVEKFPRQL